mmetsp:Transcript_96199/g.267277  ORF Transcript_96199/g.267277 Transcript_96199/m.267277 type:complete len:243 (+) Transcript_96199:86-814(+)
MGKAEGQTQSRGGIWQYCCTCSGIDAWECLPCIDESHQPSLPSKAGGRRSREASSVDAKRLEELTRELFCLHDLNNNGLLEELELVKLNEKIAILHHGKDTDIQEVRSKYRNLFRSKLDPNGLPVPYETFRVYTLQMVDCLDTDPEAQEMILEQFVAEAQSGRRAFDFSSLVSESDSPIWASKQAVDPKSSAAPEHSAPSSCSIYPACSHFRILSCCSRPRRTSRSSDDPSKSISESLGKSI